ncbi:hypothetical protein RJ639_013293 [Escallonia herrerae]|uniref:Zinc finger, CCHC-type n=1 Tax=Escallonia herrerae TaxID=1293975 RepID=A0AA88VIP8_9ASTE|nr:hypothetical protein RJ639_013293 [Escallonia herrerae]
MVNAKALWESLERKYKTEDAGSKKFVVGKFLDFKMMDSKTVISQVQEFQLILHDIHAEGMVLGESFQVAALIEKLPPTWKDFKNYLKHKRKEMKLEDLIVRLRIEEDNRQSEKKAGNYHQEAKANVVEQGLTPLLNTIKATLSSVDCSGCQEGWWKLEHLVFHEAKLDQEERQELKLHVDRISLDHNQSPTHKQKLSPSISKHLKNPQRILQTQCNVPVVESRRGASEGNDFKRVSPPTVTWGWHLSYGHYHIQIIIIR